MPQPTQRSEDASHPSHTPGPWHVEIGPDRLAVRRITAFDQSRYPYVARSVCDLPAREDAEEDAALEADARLIAAAPEMLQALERIDANAAESVEWIRRVAREAIAKAKGEA